MYTKWTKLARTGLQISHDYLEVDAQPRTFHTNTTDESKHN